MATAKFSIRWHAASMRAAAGAEARRPFDIEDLPPLGAPSFRWWGDELATAVAAAASSHLPTPRRSLGMAMMSKKRSISDLFTVAPPSAVDPVDSSGGSEHPDVDDDETLCAIVMQAKEEKMRKRKLQEDVTSAATAEGSGRRELEGNFATRKEALDKPNFLDGPDTQASNKPEDVQLLGKEKEKIKDVNIEKKGDSPNYNESKKASKVGKPRDLGKMLSLHSILKKYTKHISVEMVKEKQGSSKGIELRCKSVKRVKFSEVNDVFGSKTQSCKLPKHQSLHKLIPDAMASSSLSLLTSSSFTGMSGEGDKCINTESNGSHRPEEALTQNKEASQNTKQTDSPQLPLIDLNKALPESTDLDYTYDSNSEIPNVEHTHEQILKSRVQVLDGRENQRDMSSASYGLRWQQPATNLETVQNECRPLTEQIVRLMGKDLTVSTSKGECSSEMAEKHVATSSFNDHLKRNVFLELPQGQSFVSLHGQGLPNVSVSPTSTSHVSAYAANTSQTYFGYRTPHDSRHPFTAANAFSGDRSSYEHRSVDFLNPPSNQHLQVGCPLLSNHGSAAFHQNSLPPWCYNSDPFSGTEPFTTPFLLPSRQHETSSSVPHGNMPQPYSVHPTSSSVRPHNFTNFMFSHPERFDQGASGMRRDAALPSRNIDNIMGRVIPENVRKDATIPSRNVDNIVGRDAPKNVRVVPDNSNASSSEQDVHKRPGPVKLAPGAKHILVPSNAAVDNNSVPIVYSRVSFGRGSGNASSSHNSEVSS